MWLKLFDQLDAWRKGTLNPLLSGQDLPVPGTFQWYFTSLEDEGPQDGLSPNALLLEYHEAPREPRGGGYRYEVVFTLHLIINNGGELKSGSANLHTVRRGFAQAEALFKAVPSAELPCFGKVVLVSLDAPLKHPNRLHFSARYHSNHRA